ncbi:hypothetical protein H0H81_004936 [Sphagnurus paluster]|uniref:Gfd2/YDR514C-like C-terminal domain-containing protein n=1 Tax=Sphagnurus paluster TaxID=117069 RepID=A0A9P7FXW2_9AGAR|nr:hypothetical protein H0H81_004936 [Sphagnurus paluster]
MELTKDIIPLPYSDCLLTESNLRGVSPVVYADGGALRNSLKKIDKNNKRLKGSNPVLTSRREAFERVRSFWAEKRGVWCAIDFEAWERDHTVITEFGWRLVGWTDDKKEVQEAGHLIVDEHQKFRNSQYVPEHRYVSSSYFSEQISLIVLKDYGFGESEIVKKVAFKSRVCDFITQLGKYGAVFLVFHDNNQDIKYLRSDSINATLEGLSYVLPDTMPDGGMFVVDTSDLFAALEGATTADRRGLGRMCNLIQIPTKNMHNAGNDAYYTLEAMISMAGGDPVDIQREKRWPNQTGQGVKVDFKPHEENSDLSDEEGVAPGPINGW